MLSPCSFRDLGARTPSSAIDLEEHQQLSLAPWMWRHQARTWASALPRYTTRKMRPKNAAKKCGTPYISHSFYPAAPLRGARRDENPNPKIPRSQSCCNMYGVPVCSGGGSGHPYFTPGLVAFEATRDQSRHPAQGFSPPPGTPVLCGELGVYSPQDVRR